jgi:glycosyltransferase involved in cell wall biosynthesis
MKEVATRPTVYKFWKWVEKRTVPAYEKGYTVNHPIAVELEAMYGVHYEVIRNISRLVPLHIPVKKDIYILYQGAVNEGRGFETLIPAMQWVDVPLIICGNGNFMEQTKALVKKYQLEEKVLFMGKLPPEELKNYTLNAFIGITLFDDKGKSNYYSLANRFFDYLHAGVPQLCVDYPVYHEINEKHKVALLTADLSPENIAFNLNLLLKDDVLYKDLQQNCLAARETLNWQQEEKKLIHFYNELLA